MKNHIELCINGGAYHVYGEDAFLPLSDYLRDKLHLSGTKEVCLEGDCGACTVLLGKVKNGKINYETIDSCICYVYQLDGCHVVTVEGIKNLKLNSVQEAMISNHGAQCGYCTPGIVVSLYSFFNSRTNKTCTRADIQNALTGNLCRCTGYETIIEAGLSIKNDSTERLSEIYDEDALLTILQKQIKENIEIITNDYLFYQPSTLKEAVELKNKNPDAKILAGGTDLHVMCNKRDFNLKKIIYVSCLEELKNIEVKNDCITIGATVTLSEIEQSVAEHYSGLKEFLNLFASPQIKNIGTLIGNIANASPIGDTLPFLLVMDSELILENTNGKRKININNFYKGYKSLAMDSNEIITHVNIPLLKKDEILKLYKVSKRKHLDISSFSAAIKMKEKNGVIESFVVAFGGVGPTVQRIYEIENYLGGKRFCEDVFNEASKLIEGIIKPISDVRGHKEYRLELAKNILKKFYFDSLESKKEKVFA